MDTNLSLSLELIYLMEWLLKNDKQFLNAMAKHAIKNGLLQDLKHINIESYLQNPESLYTTVLDFLVFLENALTKNLEKTSLDSKTEDVIFPTIKKIDPGFLGSKVIRLSMQQTREKLIKKNILKQKSNQQENVKKTLLEHIIKNWHPTKNEIIN